MGSAKPGPLGQTTRKTLLEEYSRNAIDAHVGARIRAVRIALGYTREMFSTSLGVTAEQLTGWERGSLRIGAAELLGISDALRVSPAAFFPDFEIEGEDDAARGAAAETPSVADGLKLLSIFFRIADAEGRAKVLLYAAERATHKAAPN